MTSPRYRRISAGGNCVTSVTRLAHDRIAGQRQGEGPRRLASGGAQVARAFDYSSIEQRATPRESGIMAVTLRKLVVWRPTRMSRHYKRISAVKNRATFVTSGRLVCAATNQKYLARRSTVDRTPRLSKLEASH